MMRVLIVEDEVDLAESLSRGLTAEGYSVDIATDGVYGLELARTDCFAAIILDLMLPSLNGYQICRRLRHEGVDTPILVLSAKDGTYDHAEALDAGADDFIAKPFSYPVLLAHLRALDRRRARIVPADLVVGDLTINTSRRTCTRSGRSIALTPREFAVLEVLMRQPGQIVTKDEILLQAWPGEAEDPNLVEARVSSLRRKVDAPFKRTTVLTVRAAGYRVIDDLALPTA